MMQQYLDVKGRNPGSILFFRLGDFYEMFFDDAVTASKELDLVLTTRDKAADPDERIPMCGVPHHSAEPYIAKLVSKGYKVAICEQLQDPATVKGIVERDVVRLLTPGTLMEASMLDEERSNYLCSLYFTKQSASACFADLSTGEISVTEWDDNDIGRIKNELASFAPSEVLLFGDCEQAGNLINYIQTQLNCPVETDKTEAQGTSPADIAVKSLMLYLEETQKTDILHLRDLHVNKEKTYMEMDLSTIRNLELVASIRSGEKRGSLLWVLDKAKTTMGKRMLRSWVLRPLLSVASVKRRQSAVAELVSEGVIRGELTEGLRKINDIERLIGRIAFGNAGCRDLKALSQSIKILPELTKLLTGFASAAMRESAAMDTLMDIAEQIERTIKEDPPFSVREGGFICDGFDSEVDRLRYLLGNSTQAMADIEARERERTGNKKLKVDYNKVFGYYIEITRSASDDVPDDYIRKQTLTNSERFITQELKELETQLLSARDDLASREFKLFEELRCAVAEHTLRVQETSTRIAELDVLCSFAEVAVRNNYCLPEIDAPGCIDIKDGRHPVVELLGEGSLFVPNDTLLDCDNNRTAIITGPNMAGKSTYMRQTALIVLMAQIGSYVPAKYAKIGIVDRVFTRIGASDDISAGKSTFMVEMTEVAEILAYATRESLLILDEIGRGTSTYDGMSVARAVLEHCNDKKKLGAKTMFATHFHELAVLEDELNGLRNLNISAKKRGDELIFLRKIVPGSADESYGIEVAALAGVPASVTRRAKEILTSLENDNIHQSGQRINRSDNDAGQMSLIDMGASEIAKTLGMTDLNTLTPLEALHLLFELKKKL